MNGFGEDQKSHDEWTKAKDEFIEARNEHEIFQLGTKAAQAKRMQDLRAGGMKAWEAEATINVERADPQTPLGRAVVDERDAYNRRENKMHERDAARNRAWKR